MRDERNTASAVDSDDVPRTLVGMGEKNRRSFGLAIGARVRQARETACISARELDKLSGISQGHVSLIEAGRKWRVSAETVALIGLALGVSLDWMILGRGNAPTPLAVAKHIHAARRRAGVRN